MLANPLLSPIVLRMALLLFVSAMAFGLGWFAIRRLRQNIDEESESLRHEPMSVEGLPIHAYHTVIQQLKQQKHELTTQQLSERRKAKASDALSTTILSNLSCGVRLRLSCRRWARASWNANAGSAWGRRLWTIRFWGR